MIPWWVVIIALFAGVLFGIMMIAVISAGKDENDGK